MTKGKKTQLNPSQQQAVAHEKGPVLVVAGAGTGKTRVITERIKNLIQERGVSSKEILALTFTEKAAQEMETRVGDIMPLGYEEPWINTFHSVCDRILKKEGLEIGLNPGYKILSSSAQWLLLRKHLFDLELSHFRPLGNPTKFISAILKFISRLQDEAVSPEDLDNFVKNMKADEDETKRWKELAHVYNKYQELKIQDSKLDFGDLINWTIRLFSERPTILKKYQNQFKHVLVDEFQDTNYAQYKLVKMLCPQDMGDRSLLVVGDDSQSIYKFRGAAVSNILEFMKDYPEAEMITILDNFRSGQKILDGAYSLVQNNNPDSLESKLGISKKLVSQIEGANIQPFIICAETVENEVDYVISKIYELLGKEPTFTYRDIAILARANNHLDAFVMALKKHGIPYQLVGNRGLYDQDEVRDVMALVKVVINPKDSISLYRALNIDSFDIPQQVISTLLSESKYNRKDIWDVSSSIKNERLMNFRELITKYQDKITKSTPVEFVFNMVQESGYLKQYLSEESIENKLAIKNLDLFLNIIKKFEAEYRSHTNLSPNVVDLMDHLELLIEAGDNPAQAEIEDIDTVNLITVHSAKGLEFPVVFMVNLVAGRFPTNNRSDPIEIPEELINEELPSGDEHIQEERRLFYVGMTRAKKYLFMTYAENYGGKRNTKPSGFLSETKLPTQKAEENKVLQKESEQKELFGIGSKFRDSVQKDTNFKPTSLNYSKIDAYKTCPLKYKYQHILNVPTMPNHALSFGMTIHNTLRDFHQRALFKKLALDELLKIYEKNWEPLGYLNEEHRNFRFEEGKRLMEKYYEKHKDDKTKPLELEKNFSIKIDGVKFNGRIDRIDSLEGGVEIIDYKTGSTKTQKEVDKDDQVAFYAIATKEALKMEPKKLTYYFLESGEKISTTRSDIELSEIKHEVTEIIDKMEKGDFEAKSGMHCNWCDYKEFCPYAFKG